MLISTVNMDLIYQVIFIALFITEREARFPFKKEYLPSNLHSISGHRPPIGMDCETIYTTQRNNRSIVMSRVSVVDEQGNNIYSRVIRPPKTIINLNTPIKGVTHEELHSKEGYYEIRKTLIAMLSKRIVAGYKLPKCFDFLRLYHPLYLRRDVAYFDTFRKHNFGESAIYGATNLKDTTKRFLGLDIKKNGYNTTENAIVSLNLYKQYQAIWDQDIFNQLQTTSIAFSIDCVMIVGESNHGKVEMIARISIVNFFGLVTYDKLFKPTWPVVDYRSNVTGLYAENFTDAVFLNRELEMIKVLLKGKRLVGYGLSRIMYATGLRHKLTLYRDVSSFHKFLQAFPHRVPSLKEISEQFLNKTFDEVPHDPLKTAHIAMLLYIKYKADWEDDSFEIKGKQSIKQLAVKRYKIIPIAVYYTGILVDSSYGKFRAIGRITMVNQYNYCTYDKFVRPNNMSIVNCYTNQTGIHISDAHYGDTIHRIRQDLNQYLKGKLLIGYKLQNLFQFIGLRLPALCIRDISMFKPFLTPLNTALSVNEIARKFLDIQLSESAHPVEKARVFMNLYLKFKEDWDISVKHAFTQHVNVYQLNKVISNVHHKGGFYEPVAMHCAAVTVKNWKQFNYQMLARITLVNQQGLCIYDKYIKPFSEIVDYHTNVTGIHPEFLVNGEDYYKVIDEVFDLIQNKTVIGEMLSVNCFQLLRVKMVWWLLRDTFYYSKFIVLRKGHYTLNEFCSRNLGFTIKDETNPIERAQAFMKVYKAFQEHWENEIDRKFCSLRKETKKLKEYKDRGYQTIPKPQIPKM